MTTITTPHAPKPVGHYSQAFVNNGLVYVSGQLPIDPDSGEKHIGTIEEQTRQVLTNIAAILKSAGSDICHILKATVYIADIALWDRVDAAYADFLGEHRPARAIVPVKELHFGFQIEIEVIAAVK